MPTYQYACPDCGLEFERIQKFIDDPIRKCPKCGKRHVYRVVSKVAVTFKGSGWYVTDSKKSGTASGAPDGAPDGKADAADKADKAEKVEKADEKAETKDTAKVEAKTEAPTVEQKAEAKPAKKAPAKK
jgi:putative FmdB family regulatory protein